MFPATEVEMKCPKCSAPLSASLRHCTTCQFDAGAPNVRASRTEENLKELIARYDKARANTMASGCVPEFSTFSKVTENESGVVITMTASYARHFLGDHSQIYNNYENLVGRKIRKPSTEENDRRRIGVTGILFGSYADEIRYGALSLTEKGLPTYGDVYCRLREVAISSRTSFLETNSYKFVVDHDMKPGDEIPSGYVSCWEDRSKLVLAKLADRLSSGQNERDWQQILIESDGNDRMKDDFVEAHIFEGFDRNAIESVVKSADTKLSRDAQLDADTALELFNQFMGKPK